MRFQNHLTRWATIPSDIRHFRHKAMPATCRIGKLSGTFPVRQGRELLRDVLAFEQRTTRPSKQALRARIGKQDLPAARDENGFTC